MKQLKKVLVWLSLISIGFMISACGPTSDKTRIQQDIDTKNPNNNQAFCIRVAKAYYNNRNFPFLADVAEYNIEPKDKEKYPNYLLDEFNESNQEHVRFSLLTKMGLFEKGTFVTGTTDGNGATNRFYLTDEGKKYANFWGGINLCFGRIVVDEIINTPANEADDNSQFKVINFSYHLDNVPDWMKEEPIYSQYASHSDFINLVLGKQLTGKHTYKVADDGTLTLWEGIRGNRYIL